MSAFELAVACEALGAGEILLNCIDMDGQVSCWGGVEGLTWVVGGGARQVVVRRAGGLDDDL